MPIIDAHVHVIDTYPSLTPFEDVGRVDRLLHLMDQSQVDQAVMLPVVAPASPANNAECARWARQHPDRLINLVDVPLDEEDAAEQVERARDQFGAAGVSCYPRGADLRWMLDEAAAPVWDALAHNGLICNLHVGPPNYGVLLELAGRRPDVTFVLNHLGLPGQEVSPDGPEYRRLGAARALPNVFVKASAFYGAARRPWDPHCPRALSFLAAVLDMLGADRVLWGTDWPPTSRHLTYHQAVELVRSCAVFPCEDDRRLVLGDNAARVFGSP